MFTDATGSRYPLSGDVTQAINPWTWWAQAVNGGYNTAQSGLVQFNTYHQESGDPALEAQIVREVAGYGMQLGKILDAAVALIDATGAEKHADTEQRADFNDIRELKRKIDARKAEAALKHMTGEDADAFINGLKRLEKADPQAAKAVKAKLKTALD